MRICFLVLLVSSVSGCPSIDELPCGTEDRFRFQGCDRATLAGVDVSGVWTNRAIGDEGQRFLGAWSLSPLEEATIDGFPVEFIAQDADTLHLRLAFTSSNGRSIRTSYVGCSSDGPQHIEGFFEVCDSGTRVTRGSFTARRLPEPEGAIAEGLTLEGEAEIVGGTAARVVVEEIDEVPHAFVAALAGGLQIFDVSDPTLPALVGEVAEVDESFQDVLVHDGFAYVASDRRGVRVYDVSNPIQPTHVARYPDRESLVNVFRLALDEGGSRLFATSPTPLSELFVMGLVGDGTLEAGPSYRADFAAPEAGSVPLGIVVRGDRLYVNHGSAGYAVMDVSNADAPTLLGLLEPPPDAPSRTSVVAELPVGGAPRTVAFHGGRGWGAKVRVLDVTVPAEMAEIGAWGLGEERSVQEMALLGSRLYVAYGQSGLRVLDVSAPDAPVEVAHYETWSPDDEGAGDSFYEGATSVTVPGDGYVYLTDERRGLVILSETGD